MRTRSEEEEEPEPEPEEEPTAPQIGAPAGGHWGVSTAGAREFEYRTDLLTTAEVVDGTTLPGRLTAASEEGWDLVDIVGAGDRHAILLRRPKRPEQASRPVGFAPPSR